MQYSKSLHFASVEFLKVYLCCMLQQTALIRVVIFLPIRSVCSIFSDAKRLKSDVRALNFISDVTFAPPQKTPNDVQKMSLFDVKCQK